MAVPKPRGHAIIIHHRLAERVRQLLCPHHHPSPLECVGPLANPMLFRRIDIERVLRATATRTCADSRSEAALAPACKAGQQPDRENHYRHVVFHIQLRIRTSTAPCYQGCSRLFAFPCRINGEPRPVPSAPRPSASTVAPRSPGIGTRHSRNYFWIRLEQRGDFGRSREVCVQPGRSAYTRPSGLACDSCSFANKSEYPQSINSPSTG